MLNGDGLAAQEVVLAARAAYLLHGGTPEGWGQMRPDDIQLIYIAYSEERTRLQTLFSSKE